MKDYFERRPELGVDLVSANLIWNSLFCWTETENVRSESENLFLSWILVLEPKGSSLWSETVDP